jgi:hypothetical protein
MATQWLLYGLHLMAAHSYVRCLVEEVYGGDLLISFLIHRSVSGGLAQEQSGLRYNPASQS